jgi:sulfocyanin
VGRFGWREVNGIAVASLLVLAGTLEAQAPGVVDQSWLSWDSATKTVHFKLTAGLTGLNGALNFNGFRDGGLTLIVPAGSPMVVEFENHDGMLPHSAQVILNMTPVPGAAMDQAAIARAYTDKVGEGLPPQSKDRMRFTATPAGEYLFFCGVPGHGLAGMWIRLSVSDTAKAPALLATPKS